MMRSQSARPVPGKRYPFIGRSAYRSNEVIPEGQSSHDSDLMPSINQNNLSNSSSSQDSECEVANEYSAAQTLKLRPPSLP